jgi:hypothetical protein
MPLLCWVLWVLTWHCATSPSGRRMLACAVVSFTGRGCLQPASQRRQARGPLRPAGTRVRRVPASSADSDWRARGLAGLPRAARAASQGGWRVAEGSVVAVCSVRKSGRTAESTPGGTDIRDHDQDRDHPGHGNLNAPHWHWQSRWGRGRGVRSCPANGLGTTLLRQPAKKARLPK